MTQPPGQDGPPEGKNRVPLIVVVTAVVLLVLGAGAFFLLRDRDGGTAPVAGAGTSSATATSTRSAPPTTNADVPPSGAQPPEPAGPTGGGPAVPAGGGAFEGSGDVARAWVEAMADGEWQSAFDLSCPEVQDAATAAAAESDDPPYELGAYFFTRTLGGSRFTEATLDGVEHSGASGTDVATFTLALDTDEPFTLHVHVDEALTVCDFR